MDLLMDYHSEVLVNTSKIKNYIFSISEEISYRINLLKSKGYTYIPESFNSSKQVIEFFSANLGIKLTSVSAQVLSDLAAQHEPLREITDIVCEIRSLLKKKSALESHLKLYRYRAPDVFQKLSFMFQKGENSERISTSPSVNTIPNPFRYCVEPHEGNKFVFLDYRSAELALLIYLSKDVQLYEIYLSTDIFSYIANKLSCTREKAKVCVYAYLYGSTTQSISKELRIPLAQATQFLSSFDKEFPSLKEYKSNYLTQSNKNKYAFTVYGAKKLCELENSFDRVSFNYHIQSSFAQWMLEGINKLINLPNSEIKFITAVFDSILVEVPKDMNVAEVVKKINECMMSSKSILYFLPAYKVGCSEISWGDCMKEM